ncbi:NAD-dependent epimerase/dehydratase family protein [Vibrio parahaemolyticus]|nr:NAD-dependent epimerase/dehydratase family protein [Vibrio parahaemolyticus]
MGILVTGAGGFIGRELMEIIPDAKAVSRNSLSQTFKNSIQIPTIDENTNWQGAFDDVSTIIHLAGLAHSHSSSLADYYSINVKGTLHLAREAVKAGVKRFVFVSSIGVNGKSTTNKPPFSHSSKEFPESPYAESKYEAEKGLRHIAEKSGLELVVVRPTLVYGVNAPGNFGALVKALKFLPFSPFGSIDNRRDFISVQNLADLLVTCANHPKAPGNTFFASDCSTVSLREFIDYISFGIGRNIIQLPIPEKLMRLVGDCLGKRALVEQLLDDLEVDATNLKEVLDWTPPFSMKQAMSKLSK